MASECRKLLYLWRLDGDWDVCRCRCGQRGKIHPENRQIIIKKKRSWIFPFIHYVVNGYHSWAQRAKHVLDCMFILHSLITCLPVYYTWDIVLSANVYYLGYCLVCQCILPGVFPCLPICIITLVIALSANAYYLRYFLIHQCVLPWISPCLPVHITWGISSSTNVYYWTLDIALSASTYYLGYFLVHQCVLPWIMPCLPVHIIWGIASSANAYYLCVTMCDPAQCILPGVGDACQLVLPRILPCLSVCVTWDKMPFLPVLTTKEPLCIT